MPFIIFNVCKWKGYAPQFLSRLPDTHILDLNVTVFMVFSVVSGYLQAELVK